MGPKFSRRPWDWREDEYTFEPAYFSPPTRIDIAAEQARSGDLKQALRTLEDYRQEFGGYPVRPALGMIARIQVERREEKETLTWASELTLPTKRRDALLGVAEGLLQQEFA